jgi:hypothetical protein
MFGIPVKTKRTSQQQKRKSVSGTNKKPPTWSAAKGVDTSFLPPLFGKSATVVFHVSTGH